MAKALHLANRSTFDYYYNRMRKMTVLREFAKVGANVKKYYDEIADEIITGVLTKRVVKEDGDGDSSGISEENHGRRDYISGSQVR